MNISLAQKLLTKKIQGISWLKKAKTHELNAIKYLENAIDVWEENE